MLGHQLAERLPGVDVVHSSAPRRLDTSVTRSEAAVRPAPRTSSAARVAVSISQTKIATAATSDTPNTNATAATFAAPSAGHERVVPNPAASCRWPPARSTGPRYA